MKKYSSVFRSFLVSYIIILIIPSIAGFISYRTSISVTQKLSIENSVMQLQKSKELLERRMAEVEGFTRQLAINPDLNVLMNEKNNGEQTNVYGIWKMLRSVLTFGQTNDFLQQFYIYLGNYNVILTPGSAYVRPEHFYDNFRYEDQSLAEWKQSILGKTHRSEIMPLRKFYNKGTTTSVVTYMQSFPLDSFSGSSPAVAVVMIDENTITNLLTGITDKYGGWTQISDASGRPIASLGSGVPDMKALAKDTSFDESKTSQFYNDDLVITIHSDTNGWVYRSGIPRHALLEYANQIKFMTWTFTGIAIAVGLLVGLLLAYRNSVPIHKLVSVVKEQFGKDETTGRNEYDFLHGNIAEMIRSSNQLESELRRQLPLIRDAFLKRLLSGELQSREEIFAAASQANTGIYGHSGYVCILHIQGYTGMDSVEVLNELHAARLLLKQALLDIAGFTLTTDWGSDRIVIVFAAKEAETGNALEREDIASLLDQLLRHAFDEYRISFTAALGGSFESETEVNVSYEQAKQTMDHALHADRKGVVWFDEIRLETATYYYPLDMELRLIGTIRAGESEEARRLVRSVLSLNTEQRELSVEMWQQLVGELKGTLLKLLDQKLFMESGMFEQLKDQIIAIQAADKRSFQNEIEEIAQSMCSVVVSRKNDGHTRIIEAIKAYISQHFSDSDLTLYRVAEEVERPEKYISQLFKEVTGSNLSDYLEQVRMEHAIALLRENRYTVDEISSRAGYNSSHSFRRAFKRVTGVSPSSYRQIAE
ncbi:helix-turn-helix domain-containing protein [Paenibacillus glycanilyticus]|uniref:helix-turn-helix domain-containing protein n=1 Tax=Paenibacillus glycanilyticus TaxID=126569 RepID=UPI00203CE758|nr:helix-turn-helix domain-containing protein [Paenibacillus glycanilyticus]MCM3628280.1 helix-turn-helix domain-containing protein [Paenibacillus glycanilyticus]